MYEHAPEGYVCPFCLVVEGIESEHVHTKRSDVFFRDQEATAFISSLSWERNRGNALIIPNVHVENVYTMPDVLLARVQSLGRDVALAFKKLYRCDGVSFRQHNEPAGNQEVWHYHLHVLPRYQGDELYARHREKTSIEQSDRAGYAERLREYFGESRRD